MMHKIEKKKKRERKLVFHAKFQKQNTVGLPFRGPTGKKGA